MGKHILSVSYDEALLKTREMLLSREGYTVTSALGFISALKQCKKGKFDLFILGHSIPDDDKQELIKVFRAHCPSPVLALRRHGENMTDGADVHAYPDDVGTFLKEVSHILNGVSSSHEKPSGGARP